MKTNINILLLLFIVYPIFSQEDTMHVYLKPSLGLENIRVPISDIDSIIYYTQDLYDNKKVPFDVEVDQVEDIDGNVYKTVKIGEQEWMAENIKVTHYPNGDPIPLVSSEWSKIESTDTSDAYYSTTKDGHLYTHGAAIADNWERDNKYRQGICPDGWHLPSAADWAILFYTLEELGYTNNATALKSKAGWSNNGNGYDNFQFNAQSAGYIRYNTSAHSSYGTYGYWWTNDEYDVDGSRYISISYKDSVISSARYIHSKASGLSVRCIKNDMEYDMYEGDFIEFMDFKAPSVITLGVSRLTTTSATLNGEVIETGGIDIIDCGVIISESPDLINSRDIKSINRGVRKYEVSAKELIEDTRYYCASYAINPIDTCYGATVTFKTKKPIQYNSVVDIQGNEYKTITIGNQTWMAENLKTTAYNNGDSIPLIEDRDEWASINTPACCWPFNDKEGEGKIFGAFYNSYAIREDICPSGWHVATPDDWDTLVKFAGGYEIAGGRLKEADKSHWGGENVGATDDFGFTALPAGARGRNGAFGNIYWFGQWWSYYKPNAYSSEVTSWSISANGVSIGRSDQNYLQYKSGLSVRCVKN